MRKSRTTLVPVSRLIIVIISQKTALYIAVEAFENIFCAIIFYFSDVKRHTTLKVSVKIFGIKFIAHCLLMPPQTSDYELMNIEWFFFLINLSIWRNTDFYEMLCNRKRRVLRLFYRHGCHCVSLQLFFLNLFRLRSCGIYWALMCCLLRWRYEVILKDTRRDVKSLIYVFHFREDLFWFVFGVFVAVWWLLLDS